MADNTSKTSCDFLQIKVGNISDWAKAIAILQGTEQLLSVAFGEVFGNKKWVFRGQANATWQITSSLERMNRISCSHLRDPERYFRAIEQDAIAEFKRQAHSLIGNDNLSNLEWTMLMRHYGVPTRLVDFTEIPFLALFFALETESTEDFAVWAVELKSMSDWYVQSKIGSRVPGMDELSQSLSPDQINELINRNESDLPAARLVLDFFRTFKNTRDNSHKRIVENRHFAERLFSADIDTILPEMKKLPALYLYAEKPDTRQRVQHGLFLMSTYMSSPFMDALKRSLGIAIGTEPTRLRLEECLAPGAKKLSSIQNAKLLQFLFKGSLRKECRDFLRSVGISPASVYPDFFGISTETKNRLYRELNPFCDMTDCVRNHLPDLLAGKSVSLKLNRQNESLVLSDFRDEEPLGTKGKD